MELSVLIPTYNRVELLEQTLRGLASQSGRPGEYEVVVIDDGSTDETASVVRGLQKGYPVPLHYLFQENRKQGAARNLGARKACGRLLVLLGDDIVPVSHFLHEHRSAHERIRTSSDGRSSANRTVVIGYTTWPDDYSRTPFLDYIGEQGWQFGFSLIQDPGNVPFNYFYTSNLSMHRDFFLEAGGFDESFQEYGWEDIELSLRLKHRGMHLIYHPAATAYHHHATTLASFIQRQRKVGYSAWNFYRRHPEMKDFLGIEDAGRYSWMQHIKLRLITWICRLVESLRWPDLSHFYPHLMTYYYLQGVEEARGRWLKEDENPVERDFR